jgi:hypothetical protein
VRQITDRRCIVVAWAGGDDGISFHRFFFFFWALNF